MGARRVLVTGGAGFIGSHVVEALVAEGWQVAVIDDLSRGRPEQVPGGAELLVAPVESQRARAFVLAFRPEVAVHLAARVSVAHSQEDPFDDARVNVLGTVAMARACIVAGCRRLVLASSAAVYGTPRACPVREDHPLMPSSPYGVSKLAAEHYTRVLAEAAGIAWCVLRYANVYGPRQNAEGEAGVVAAFAAALARGRPLTVHGDGTQTRDFVYVTDVAEATLRAVSAPAAAGAVIHVGTGEETSVRELASAIWKAAGRSGEPEVEFGPPRPGDVRRSALSCERARRLLGWAATVDLASGLRRTLAWGRW